MLVQSGQSQQNTAVNYCCSGYKWVGENKFLFLLDLIVLSAIISIAYLSPSAEVAAVLTVTFLPILLLNIVSCGNKREKQKKLSDDFSRILQPAFSVDNFPRWFMSGSSGGTEWLIMGKIGAVYYSMATSDKEAHIKYCSLNAERNEKFEIVPVKELQTNPNHPAYEILRGMYQTALAPPLPEIPKPPSQAVLQYRSSCVTLFQWCGLDLEQPLPKGITVSKDDKQVIIEANGAVITYHYRTSARSDHLFVLYKGTTTTEIIERVDAFTKNTPAYTKLKVFFDALKEK